MVHLRACIHDCIAHGNVRVCMNCTIFFRYSVVVVRRRVVQNLQKARDRDRKTCFLVGVGSGRNSGTTSPA